MKHVGVIAIGRPDMPDLSRPLGGRGAYGIRVYLLRSFAERVMGFILDPKDRDDLQRVAREQVLELLWPQRKSHVTPFIFYEDTPLVQNFCAEQDERRLGANADDIAGRGNKEWIIYNPKNVDDTRCAYALLGLVTIWADYVDHVLRTPRKKTHQ